MKKREALRFFPESTDISVVFTSTGFPLYKPDRTDYHDSGGMIMLTVTTTAKDKLKETLQKQTTDPEVAIRVTSLQATPPGVSP